ncbi:6671_t:CDS:2, partial [Acaulospora colombiana]
AFKEDNQDKIFYVKSLWRIDPLKDLSLPDDKVIFELEVTDCKMFWTRSVTVADLKRIKPANIHDISKYCGATQAALSGHDEYENHKLTCRITTAENYVRVAGSALETRVSDLENVRDQMQERIELMIAEKINHESILMEKFKKVLNAKKKKIKNLMRALNATGKLIFYIRMFASGSALMIFRLGAIISSQPEQSQTLSEEEELTEENDEMMINSSTSRRSTNVPHGHRVNQKPTTRSSTRDFKKLKLDDDDAAKNNKSMEVANKQQNAESVLTKTFRGQIMKSRRMGRKKVATTATSNDAINSLNDILVTANNPNANALEDNSQEASDQDNTVDNLLGDM